MTAVLLAAMTGAPPPPPVKVCACGRPHDVNSWRSLRFVGHWRVESDVLELRDCVCGSTIAILVERAAVPS